MTVADRIGVMDNGRLDAGRARRARCTRRRVRAGSRNSSATSICSRARSRRARTAAAVDRNGDAGTIAVAEPREPITGEAISVAIRPEKVRLSRRGPAPDTANSPAIDRLEGVVSEVSYLGGLTAYKVKLDTGAVVRSSLANTVRLDVDAYQAGQRVVAWFTPDDCVVLEQ